MDQVFLQPWTVDDLPVLERSNTNRMTSFLGGPESREQLVKRHAKFLRLWDEGGARMFTIRADSEEEPVGSVGFAFRGEEDFEYPKGNPIRVIEWSFDLTELREEYPHK